MELHSWKNMKYKYSIHLNFITHVRLKALKHINLEVVKSIFQKKKQRNFMGGYMIVVCHY